MLLYLLFLIINFYYVLKIIGARCIKKLLKCGSSSWWIWEVWNLYLSTFIKQASHLESWKGHPLCVMGEIWDESTRRKPGCAGEIYDIFFSWQSLDFELILICRCKPKSYLTVKVKQIPCVLLGMVSWHPSPEALKPIVSRSEKPQRNVIYRIRTRYIKGKASLVAQW